MKKRSKIEQIGLVGLVVLLLATFSITGAMTQCGGPPSATGVALGGSFEVAPGERDEISDSEFDERSRRHSRATRALRTGSWSMRDLVGNRRLGDNPRWATWMHVLASEAATKAGYVAGEDQIRARIKQMVGGAMQREGLGFTDALYQEFLRRQFHGSQGEFEATLEEIIKKDLFLTPILRTAAYDVTYPEAYEDWKHTRERVDLEYIAVPGEGFAEVVAAEERTRATIETQQRALRDLGRASASIRLLAARAASYEKKENRVPEDFDALVEGMAHLKEQTDPWGEAFHYRVSDGAPDVRSAGPDKALDTDDDVTIDVSRAFDTHGALLRVARALATWHNAKEAWPADLAELLTAPGEGLLAPIKLQSELEDAWGNTLAYAAPTGDGVPTLRTYGPDGEADTDDDMIVEVGLERTDVAPQGAVAGYVNAHAHDAWDRPLRIVVRDPSPLRWMVSSDGLDGERGTDDDLDSGNEAELSAFFRDPEVTRDLRKPETRAFELLYVHLPQLSDETLAALWAKYPQHRPASEEAVFEEFRQYRVPIYEADDPADPKTGHGAALMAKLEITEGINLVPSRDVFPKPLEGTAPDGSSEDDPSDEDGTDDEGSDDEGSLDDGEDTSLAELREAFESKGWREVVIRDMFIEAVLADLLQRARTSSDALRAWEMKYGSQVDGAAPDDGDAQDGDTDEGDADEGDAENGDDDPAPDEGDEAPKPIPAKPELLTFDSLLEDELGQGVGFQMYRTDGAVTDDAWMEEPGLGGFTLRTAMGGLSRGGELGVIPTQLNRRLTKALVRNVELNRSRAPEMDEVRDELMAKFVEKRQIDRAAKLLRDLKDRIELAPAGEGEGEAAKPSFDEVLAAWAEENGAAHFRESTGWIVGNALPPTVEVDASLPDQEQAKQSRQRYVLGEGYATVAKVESQQDTVEAQPGTLGRRVLTDRETGTAYLVRVRDRAFPSKSEFSPRRYANYLRRKAYGPLSQGRDKNLRDMEGAVPQATANWFDEMAWMKETFDLRTNTDIMTLNVEERTR